MSAATRMLWLFTMPRLDSSAVHAVATSLGLITRVTPTDPAIKPYEFSSKLADLTEEQWLALRAECGRRCGIPDVDAADHERIRNSRVYQEWRRALRSWQERKGTAA